MLPEELSALCASAGFEAFRGRQIFHWLHKKAARSLEEMKNIPKPLREWLAANTQLGGVVEAIDRRESADGSAKFLFLLEDGRKIEAVLMPDPKGAYWTMCISSQVGCAVDCKFCLTGKNGFFRNMRADEIVDQLLFGRRWLLDRDPKSVFRNIVFMGMGEPLLNVDAVVRTIRLATHVEGCDFSPRRITVSTSGIVPGMDALGAANTGALLAISLNAPTQEERERIMPITKKYPLKDVVEAAARFPLKAGKRVTYEYVMLSGVNDTMAHADAIVRLLKGHTCKVNLIPFNPNSALPFERPQREQVDAFADRLAAHHLTVSVRWSKALDVSGACGNLATEHRQRASKPTEDDLSFFALAAARTQAEDDEEE